MAKRPSVTTSEIDRDATARSTNTNKGNERFGKAFQTQKTKGGEWHVYGGGKRVFVGGSASSKPVGTRGGQEKKKFSKAKDRMAKREMVDAIKEMKGRKNLRGESDKARRGGKPRAGINVPKPGDAGRRTLPQPVGVKGPNRGYPGPVGNERGGLPDAGPWGVAKPMQPQRPVNISDFLAKARPDRRRKR